MLSPTRGRGRGGTDAGKPPVCPYTPDQGWHCQLGYGDRPLSHWPPRWSPGQFWGGLEPAASALRGGDAGADLGGASEGLW